MSADSSRNATTLDRVQARLSTFDGEPAAIRLLGLGTKTLHVGLGIEAPTLSVGQPVRISLCVPGVHDEPADAVCKVMHVVPTGAVHVYSLDILDWVGARAQLPTSLHHLIDVRDAGRWSPARGEDSFVDLRCSDALLTGAMPIRDLAAYGLSIHCAPDWFDAMDLNLQLEMSFTVPGEDAPSSAVGFVRHIGEDELGPYIGVVFDSVLTEDFDDLHRRIAHLLSSSH